MKNSIADKLNSMMEDEFELECNPDYLFLGKTTFHEIMPIYVVIDKVNQTDYEFNYNNGKRYKFRFIHAQSSYMLNTVNEVDGFVLWNSRLRCKQSFKRFYHKKDDLMKDLIKWQHIKENKGVK